MRLLGSEAKRNLVQEIEDGPVSDLKHRALLMFPDLCGVSVKRVAV